ncbi:MAG: guanylate kinase [Bacteroidetes bacterium]|jgi:guanylate kinase|nr:guanylate kinase [Bacteroidota bacterium]
MKGLLIVVAAPSGSGKTTIAKAVMQRHPEILFSVSATTRAMRPGETHGKDYFFLTREEFETRIAANDLIEYEEIYGNLYGTLKSEVDRALAAGRVMLFDVDVKGALSIKRLYRDDALLIFIAPPSVDELRRRLENRKTEDAATVERRMARVAMELELGKEFDVRVVNDDLDRAVNEVNALVNARIARIEQLEP